MIKQIQNNRTKLNDLKESTFMIAIQLQITNLLIKQTNKELSIILP